jgi:hypothetical protein
MATCVYRRFTFVDTVAFQVRLRRFRPTVSLCRSGCLQPTVAFPQAWLRENIRLSAVGCGLTQISMAVYLLHLFLSTRFFAFVSNLANASATVNREEPRQLPETGRHNELGRAAARAALREFCGRQLRGNCLPKAARTAAEIAAPHGAVPAPLVAAQTAAIAGTSPLTEALD